MALSGFIYTTKFGCIESKPQVVYIISSVTSFSSHPHHIYSLHQTRVNWCTHMLLGFVSVVSMNSSARFFSVATLVLS